MRSHLFTQTEDKRNILKKYMKQTWLFDNTKRKNITNKKEAIDP